jgi:hypothetical protein
MRGPADQVPVFLLEDSVTVRKSIGVNDQVFFGEKLQCAVPFGIDGVAKVAVRGRKHGNDRATLMIVGCFVDPVANCKLRHRKLLLESAIIPTK